MQQNVTKKKTLHLCCKMWMSTSDSPDDTKFIFVRVHGGTSRHNWSSIVMARMDTNNCFSEHCEHAPRWSDSQKHNDNNRISLKKGFAENDVGPRPLLQPTAPRSHVFFSPISLQTLQKFLETKTRLRCHTVFLNFTRFPPKCTLSKKYFLKFQRILHYFSHLFQCFQRRNDFSDVFHH